jgi:hypothetical protein
MKRLTLAAALLASTTLPLAQMYNAPPTPRTMEAPQQKSEPAKPTTVVPAAHVEVAKFNCEPKPVFPGGAAMRAMEGRRAKYEKDIENYKKCMLGYIEERKAMHESNLAMHKAAIEEYNTTMKAINDAMEANR